jgi:pimeloyl-ACP methyl ester carboxylesterase
MISIRRWNATWSALVVVVALLLLPALPSTATASPARTMVLGGATSSGRPDETPPPPTDNISYDSSVDGYSLSYLEWLPSGYSSSASYPLAVFLHGVGTTTAWIPGGSGGIVDMTQSLVSNASTYRFILIAINTRSPEGFYFNSPCGGPQQQDVLDAITHESSLRHISSVYLIGFSMGSLGALTLAGHYPGMFAGVATAGTITDMFQTYAYNTATSSAPAGLGFDECGAEPSPTEPSIDRVWAYLSPLRFEPQNFSGIPLFVTGGGLDTRAPNNFARWDYANVNNTFINSTCAVVASMGEPANCTVTIPSLAAKDPSQYRWLDLYEPQAPHSSYQLPGAAVFAFFLDQQAGGYYVSTYPGNALIPYTPGTPIVLPNTSTPGSDLTLWTEIAIVAIVVVAVVAVVAVSRRRPS